MALVVAKPKSLADSLPSNRLAIWKAAGKQEGVDFDVDATTGAITTKTGKAAPTDKELEGVTAALRAANIYHKLENFDKQETAITDPKAYLKKFNERMRGAMTDAAVQSLYHRAQVIHTGASDREADKFAQQLYEGELVKQSLLINYEYPSDVLDKVRGILDKNRAIS